MELIYRFDTKETPELVKVGGKANSLILMTQHGLPVPTGFVLSVEFFKPWFDQIKETPEWQRVVNSSPNKLKMHTEELKKVCESLCGRRNCRLLARKHVPEYFQQHQALW